MPLDLLLLTFLQRLTEPVFLNYRLRVFLWFLEHIVVRGSGEEKPFYGHVPELERSKSVQDKSEGHHKDFDDAPEVAEQGYNVIDRPGFRDQQILDLKLFLVYHVLVLLIKLHWHRLNHRLPNLIESTTHRCLTNLEPIIERQVPVPPQIDFRNLQDLRRQQCFTQVHRSLLLQNLPQRLLPVSLEIHFVMRAPRIKHHVLRESLHLLFGLATCGQLIIDAQLDLEEEELLLACTDCGSTRVGGSFEYHVAVPVDFRAEEGEAGCLPVVDGGFDLGVQGVGGSAEIEIGFGAGAGAPDVVDFETAGEAA